MEIRQLKYFAEIYKYRNFSRAAEACFISSQGISMAILRLEEELSCKLFVRTAKGLTPTAQGEYLYPRAQQILTLLEECETYFKKGAGKEGFLTVMLSIGTIEEFAGVPIAQFREKHPNVHLDVQETFDVVCDTSVENGIVEMALTVGPVDVKKFDFELLFTSRHALIVHKDHPLANRESISIADLQDVPMAVMRDSTKTYQIYRDACRRAGFEPSVSIFADNILLVYYLAEMNQSAGISTLALANRLSRPNLRAIPFDDPAFDWSIYLIKQKNAKLSPEAKTFEGLLLQHRKDMTVVKYER
ncbi:DNA-binding transcriptional regulator, LysR family [Sporobacter termitidis DSM 10068]|uniref:DNA-binding transcriptional regulator, LysR family n=1 Tax=Sporobacter termitidis DSM 10068 TaxID=1123282 RepID=A0A1M5Y6P8_9FIRM|nr:LysR family transcriptional regulator [Sporobacter termitidis]SHI07765.1 DNA-binding transcriptional regulator, LysR family [Sporobacter termitidis DSM 10068]